MDIPRKHGTLHNQNPHVYRTLLVNSDCHGIHHLIPLENFIIMRKNRQLKKW